MLESLVLKKLQKQILAGAFPVNFAKFLRTTVFKEQLRWLLLDITILCHQVSFSWHCEFFHH